MDEKHSYETPHVASTETHYAPHLGYGQLSPATPTYTRPARPGARDSTHRAPSYSAAEDGTVYVDDEKRRYADAYGPPTHADAFQQGVQNDIQDAHKETNHHHLNHNPAPASDATSSSKQAQKVFVKDPRYAWDTARFTRNRGVNVRWNRQLQRMEIYQGSCDPDNY